MKNLKTLILLICLIVPFSFVGCENQNKTSLSTPATLTIDDGIIIFDAVADAEYYIMDISGIGEIKLDARYSNNVEIIDGKIHYNATKVLIPGETYNIKVKATASARGDSPYTSLVTYGHMQTLDTPTNVKINGTTLTWDVVENASYYVVKLITPQNKNIFDYDGNLLTKDDAESIKNAELTEYTFYTNQFNFDSLLSSAGIYKFYVSAVRVEPAEKIMSDYSSKMTYKNIKTLSTPINGTIALVDGDLHLTSVVDKNANAITVKYADTERTVEINSANTSISISGNIVDINLSKFFPADILDLDVIKQYSFKVKANYINSNENNKYYTDSEYSNVVVFENTYILSAPDITLSQDVATGYYEVSWDSADNDHVKKYEVFVFTPTGLIQPIYQIEPNENETKNKFLITTDFVSVAVRAVGAGNYITSPLSEYAVNPDISNEFTDDINFTTSNNTLHWDTVDNAYYFVQFGDLWTETNLNSCAIPVEYCTSNDYSIYVTVIKDGYIPQTLQVDLSYNPRLTAPYIANGQGFSSRNLYELSFTGSNKALGYYVYIKSADASEYVKIDTLYTSTTIDISKYITSKGEYYVCIESVADPYSIYKNSALSSPIPVTHEEVLDTPQFDKIGDENYPILKITRGNETTYQLRFYGVKNADMYEILIGGNKITEPSKGANFTGIYIKDITEYLSTAGDYVIKIRAIPSANADNVVASAYNEETYPVYRQLSVVDLIQVKDNNGVYTLSFNPQDNAESYGVRIVKQNDDGYKAYLESLGLTNYFKVTTASDISEYLQQGGLYYIYMTSLAKKGSNYADSPESTTFATVEKFTTLNKPDEIKFTNKDTGEYILSWVGDEHADYYQVLISDPNKVNFKFNVYNKATSTDISQYITLQGDYSIAIYSMVNPLSDNAKEYENSGAGTTSETYIYSKDQDFTRYSVYSYGKYYDFEIETLEDLKNILWYHYLYGIDSNLGLNIKLIPQEDEDIRTMIWRLGDEAHNEKLYPFNDDTDWIAAKDTTDDTYLITVNDTFKILCKNILETYPELNILSNLTISRANDSTNIFNLKYANALNVDKVNMDSSMSSQHNTTYADYDYGNPYQYIDYYSRKSSTAVFNIDYKAEMNVSTTEQLLHAVTHGKKPKFVGESALAQTVYSNAKIVLSAIIDDKMSDLEKVTAIFDWLEYGYNLNYYADKQLTSGSLSTAELSVYGLRKDYYLEGIFEDISLSKEGNITIGNPYATSASYSKAFALLCAIEGIEAKVINGEYEYSITSTSGTKYYTVDHVWNKVYISTTQDQEKVWLTLDLTFSDNYIILNNLTKSYGVSSHTYFLMSDNALQANLKSTFGATITDETYVISNDYADNLTSPTNVFYDYYTDNYFGLTVSQIDSIALDAHDDNSHEISDFTYSRQYDPNISYQKYMQTTGYGNLQSYLLNTIFSSEYNATKGSGNATFEFKYKNSNFTGDIKNTLQTMFNNLQINYGISLTLANLYTIVDSSAGTTTVVYVVKT